MMGLGMMGLGMMRLRCRCGEAAMFRPARGDRAPRARASTRARRTVAATCAALVTVLLAGCSSATPQAVGLEADIQAT